MHYCRAASRLSHVKVRSCVNLQESPGIRMKTPSDQMPSTATAAAAACPVPSRPVPSQPGRGCDAVPPKARGRGPPAPKLPGGPEHGARVADVHLHSSDLGGGAGGQQRGAGGLGPVRVPAGQAQVEPVVLLQQPLAECVAHAAGNQTRSGVTDARPRCRPPVRISDPRGLSRRRGRPGVLTCSPR